MPGDISRLIKGDIRAFSQIGVGRARLKLTMAA
jgi:hypothetical protein